MRQDAHAIDATLTHWLRWYLPVAVVAGLGVLFADAGPRLVRLDATRAILLDGAVDNARRGAARITRVDSRADLVEYASPRVLDRHSKLVPKADARTAAEYAGMVDEEPPSTPKKRAVAGSVLINVRCYKPSALLLAPNSDPRGPAEPSTRHRRVKARLLDPQRQEPPNAVGLEPVRRVPRRPGRLDDVELERVALLWRRVREAQVVQRARYENQVAGARRQRREAALPRVGLRHVGILPRRLDDGDGSHKSNCRRPAEPLREVESPRRRPHEQTPSSRSPRRGRDP